MKKVLWKPFDHSQFAYVGSSVELWEVYNGDNTSQQKELLSKGKKEASQLSSADWRPVKQESVLAYGTHIGSVHLINWNSDSMTDICNPSNLGKRSCNALSWNQFSPSQLAAGFENLKSEYSTIVWDFAKEDFLKISFSESSSSLQWLPGNASMIAIGTSMGWVKIYDIRMSNQSAALQIMAHSAQRPRKIRGIRPDPFHHWSFATYTDFHSDVLKVWDIRKIGTNSAKAGHAQIFTVIPRIHQRRDGSSLGNSSVPMSEAIVDVAWSPVRQGLIAVATNTQKCVSFYSTGSYYSRLVSNDVSPLVQQQNSPVSSSVPISSIAVPDVIKSLSWQGTEYRYQSTFKEQADRANTGEQTGSSQEKSLPPVWERFSVDDTLKKLVPEFFMIPTSMGNSSNVIRMGNNCLLVGLASGCGIVNVREKIPSTTSFSRLNGYHEEVAVEKISAGLRYWELLQKELVGGLTNRGPAESLFSFHDTQGTSSVMMRDRSVRGYSLHADGNSEVLSEELDAFFQSTRLKQTTGVSGNTEKEIKANLDRHVTKVLETYRVWVWVDRVETDLSLIKPRDGNKAYAGVLDILQAENSTKEKHEVFERQLSGIRLSIYCSKNRNLCRKICGWLEAEEWVVSGSTNDHSFDQRSLTNRIFDESFLTLFVKEVSMESFERAAAIALWHGNLDLAVGLLQAAIEENRGEREWDSDSSHSQHRIDWDEPLTSEYMQVVSLVAMCLAGFHTREHEHGPRKMGKDVTVKSRAAPSSWGAMCRHTMQQLERFSRRAAHYLFAACQFLLVAFESSSRLTSKVDSSASSFYKSIIGDERITLEDRVAFALTFLPESQLVPWLSRTIDLCRHQAQLEGLIITGLCSEEGVDLLQQFIDKCDDLQTVALLVCRVVDSNVPLLSDEGNSNKEWMWLQEYRNLLNTWELFIERASLDVELGKRHRWRAELTNGNAVTPSGAKTQTSGKSKPSQQPYTGKGMSGWRSKGLLYSIPPYTDFPHILLQCNFCTTPLPADGIELRRMSDLKWQKNTVHFCVNCSKQLPRCYVCQLYMGMVNPYNELTRAQERRRLSDTPPPDRRSEQAFSSITQGSPQLEPEGKQPPAYKKSGDDSLAMAAFQGGASSANSVQSGVASSNSVKQVPHNVVDFSRWFHFCQQCRHGGHAECISQWFGQGGVDEGGEGLVRNVCGVNGCNCSCNFRK